jgi:hypothetical protein
MEIARPRRDGARKKTNQTWNLFDCRRRTATTEHVYRIKDVERCCFYGMMRWQCWPSCDHVPPFQADEWHYREEAGPGKNNQTWNLFECRRRTAPTEYVHSKQSEDKAYTFRQAVKDQLSEDRNKKWQLRTAKTISKRTSRDQRKGKRKNLRCVYSTEMEMHGNINAVK